LFQEAEKSMINFNCLPKKNITFFAEKNSFYICDNVEMTGLIRQL
jgi:hypothetical protein